MEAVSEAAPGVDRAAVARLPPDRVWRPQHQRRALEAAVDSRGAVAKSAGYLRERIRNEVYPCLA